MRNESIYTVKVVENVEDLNACRFLLHQSYIVDHGWQLAPNNASNLKIKIINGNLSLVDDYDDLSLWFTVSIHDELVGCARICHEDSSGLLEIERYENAVTVLKPILEKKYHHNMVELNREAILPDYQHDKKVYLILLKSIFEYTLKNQHTIITTCNLQDWEKIYKTLLIPIHLEASFKYEYTDPSPVTTYFIDQDEMALLIEKIEKMQRVR